METALFGGPPELGNVLKLATGQIGFMSIFALPLFEGVSDLLPQMIYTVRQIKFNQSVWQRLADEQKRKDSLHPGIFNDLPYSPRSSSPVEPSQVDGRRDSSVRQDDATTSNPMAGEDRPTLYMSPRSSVESISRIAQNGGSVGQGHLTGTTPSLEVLNTALITETSSRRSSGAVLGVTAVPKSRNWNGSNESTEITGTDGTSRSPRDSPVYATTPFTDSSQSGQDTQVVPILTETQPERPCSSRHGHHHGHSRHSGLASVPSTSHRNSRGTRTQSGSTYSNPVMTPISPATNASSFLSAEDKDDISTRLFGKGELPPRRQSEANILSPTSQPTSLPASRPNSAGMCAFISRERNGDHYRGSCHNNHHHQYSPHRIRDCLKDRIRTTVVGNDVSSPTASTMKTGGSGHGEHLGTGEPAPRTVPRRRSRIRLAFWRRRHPHHEEVSGES